MRSDTFAEQSCQPDLFAQITASQICLHFLPAQRRKKIEVATSVCTGGSNCPPDSCILGLQICQQHKKGPRPNGLGPFLELLARFELATSSLPIILLLFLAVVRCCDIIGKPLEPQ